MLGERGLGLIIMVGAAAWVAAACGSGATDAGQDYNAAGGAGGSPVGANVGETCGESRSCRSGLACNGGICEPGHTKQANEPCIIGGECADGLQCLSGSCQPAGTGAQGEACTSDADCLAGLRCALVGFSLQCVPEGDGDTGAACATAVECYAGLTCVSGQCARAPAGVPTFGGELWPGVDCQDSQYTNVRAYFEVPGAAGADERDFFRLPFPNDVRRVDGKLDLTGFPTPGTGMLGYDPLQRYIDAIVASESAWGAYPTVIFRFSGDFDYESFRVQSGAPNPVSWVDITPGAQENGVGINWSASKGRTSYVCGNWLAVRRSRGQPLTPGHTYAVWLSTMGRAADGGPIDRAPNLSALLNSTVPVDPKLQAAHEAYKPLRDYLATNGIPADTILNATVFTVSNVPDTMDQLAAAVQAAPPPVARSWVKCGSGAASPCPQADDDRACGLGDPLYDEYHALVSLPIFQTGTAPYLTPADGGAIQTSAPVRNEDVCMALTVPKGTMPANGWPLVVFAHGTGGSFRSHVRAEVAGALANATTPNGAVQFAVLGIDQVEHGPRRGSSTDSPNNLFFNFANPQAARGNPLQGAADQISLARFASALDVAASETGGDAIKIDPNAIVFFGHSQGATHGSLALPYADAYRAAVLSGNGASLMDALVTKTSPVNVAGAVVWVLGDPDANGQLEGGVMHPALTLLQQWIDPADPLNFASAAGRVPPAAHTAKHLFQTYGLGDTFSPPVTLETYALAGGLALATADVSVGTPDPIGNLSPQPLPLAGNVTVSGNPVTLAVREYAPPSGKDGHFIVFDVASANADAVRFLAMAASGQVPAIGP